MRTIIIPAFAVAFGLASLSPVSAKTVNLQCSSPDVEGRVRIDERRGVVQLDLLPRAQGMLGQTLRIRTVNDQLISASSADLSVLLDRYTGRISLTRRSDNAGFEAECETRRRRF